MRVLFRSRDRRDLSEIVGRPFFESWPGLNSSLLSNAIADVLESKQARIVEIDFSEVPSNEKLTAFRVHPWGAGVILIAEGALSRKAEKLTAERQSEKERQQLQSELIHISSVSALGPMASPLRSDERRFGNECASPFRTHW